MITSFFPSDECSSILDKSTNKFADPGR
jgi:hypothetical protein